MEQHATIIIVGVNHVNTLGLIRSVGETGMRPYVIIEPCDPKYCVLRFSKYIHEFHILESKSQLIPTLMAIRVKAQDKPVILCGSDISMSIIDANLDIIGSKFHTFNIRGTQGMINRYMDKTMSFNIAREAGFDIINTWNPSSKDFDTSQVKYPCIVKGIKSIESNKSDMTICQTQTELNDVLNKHQGLIIQEYIDKDFELDIVGLSVNHGLNISIGGAVRKIRENIGSQSQYDVLEPLAKYPDIDFSIVKKLVKDIGYEGIFSVEIMHCCNKLYYLEINLRNDGTMYMYTAAGINYAKAWIDYCTGIKTDYMEHIQLTRPYYAMQITDVSNLLNKSVSPLKWFRQFIKCDTYFVLSRRDIKPFLYQIYIPLRQLLKKPLKLFRRKCLVE